MKNLFIAMTVLLTVGAANAQLQQNEVRPESGQTEYIVNAASGPVILPATDGIQLLPGVHIQNGSDLRAYINDSPYEGPVLPGGPSGENYIYTRSYQKGMPDDSGIDSNYDVIEGITYFDGLGRPMQQIAIKASPDLKDIVTHMEYDTYGRMERGYLPYEETDPLEELGSLRPDAKADTDTYYTNNYGPDLDTNAPNPYSQKLFEASPLNRVLKQAAPGEDWKMDNGHEIRFEYLTNTTNEVRRYGVNLTPDYVPTLAPDGFYTANELTKTVTKDENWQTGQTHDKDHTAEEFTDKQGRTVLKRTYNLNDPHDTYYVYDDYGNLSYVIPPKVDTSDGISATELDGLCYQYRYDHRNRLIEKKIPGKGSATDWESIVYNTLDQPIMTQDPNLKAQGKWLFTKYDAFGRVAYTGMLNSTASRATHQTNADTYAGNTSNKIWVVSGSTTIDNIVILYSNDGYPNSGYDELHTLDHYENYNGFTVPNTVMGEPVSSAIQGLPTVSFVKVLGTDQWILTVTAYDEKGRAIYTRTENTLLNTVDITESELDHAGKVLRTRTVHTKGTNTPITVEDSFEYDHAARLTGQSQRVNGQGEQLFTNTYDGIGQLVKKEVGNTKASPLEEIDYRYNIRGWMTGFNIPYTQGTGGSLFGIAIDYNRFTKRSFDVDADHLPLYNGNISAISSRSVNDLSPLGSNYLHEMHMYRYGYDALNRIDFADYGLFAASGSGGSNGNWGNSYTLKNMTYDKNGNITALERSGSLTEGTIDQLTYGYFTDENKLRSITDNVSGSQKDEGFNDGNTSGDDYAYDANGNLEIDRNKGITSITYNHLNLPTQATLNSGTIAYIYDATGIKQKKIVSTGNNTEYAGNYIYENGNLKQFYTEEGYAEPKNANDYSQGFQYVYQYSDIWGNTRITYADDNNDGNIDASSEIRREQNYYPFGLEHKGYNNVSYGVKNNLKTYQGQEFTEDLGLNVHEWRYRISDPAIGRFWQIDPLAENYTYNSTYAFQENKLGMGIELEGLENINWDELSDEGIQAGLGSGIDDGTAQKNSYGASTDSGVVGSIFSAISDGISYIDNKISGAITNGIVAVTGTAESNNTLSDSQFNDAVSAGDENAFFTGLEQESATILNTLPEIAGDAGAMAIEGGIMELIGAGFNTKSTGPGLGNQFKNKSINQVNKAMNKHVKSGKLEAKYTDPVSGSKAYKNTKSGYSYNVDTGKSGRTGAQREPAHVDVNYPNPKPRNVPSKKKLPINQ